MEVEKVDSEKRIKELEEQVVILLEQLEIKDRLIASLDKALLDKQKK